MALKTAHRSEIASLHEDFKLRLQQQAEELTNLAQEKRRAWREEARQKLSEIAAENSEQLEAAKAQRNLEMAAVRRQHQDIQNQHKQDEHILSLIHI